MHAARVWWSAPKIVEGLRLLPWLQEAERRDSVAFARTCEECREASPAQVRQIWACAYEPRVDHAQAWNGLGYTGPDPTTCPGYTTRLPETIEIARAWRWWDKGQLDKFVGDGELSDGVIVGIELFEREVRALESFVIKEKDKR